MIKKIARPLLWLLTGAIPVFIAACYGVYEEGMTRFRGKVVDKTSGQGIENIKVSCVFNDIANDETFTLPDDGAFEIATYDMCDSVTFEDVDGEENGGKYATEELDYNGEDNLTVEMTLEN